MAPERVTPHPGAEWTCTRLVELFDSALARTSQFDSPNLIEGIELTLLVARSLCATRAARGREMSLGLPIIHAWFLAHGVLDETKEPHGAG